MSDGIEPRLPYDDGNHFFPKEREKRAMRLAPQGQRIALCHLYEGAPEYCVICCKWRAEIEAI